MIRLYRTADCPQCTHIQDVLEDMAVAHEVSVVERGPNLPRLEDGDETVTGADAILEHLDRLERFQKLWYKYQSDACYCEDDEEG